jgi:hypothetical protein
MSGDERSIPRGVIAVVVEVVHSLRGRVEELHVGLDEDLPRPLTPQVATDTPLDLDRCCLPCSTLCLAPSS